MIDLKGCKRICIKLSGGADSALALFLTCKKITEEELDIDYILPVTTINRSKPFNFYYATQVLDWMEEQFPNIKILPMEVSEAKTNDDYIDAQKFLTHKMISEDRFDVIINGITLTPKGDDFNSPHNGPYEERTIEKLGAKKEIFSTKSGVWFITPFWDKDKRDLANIYEENKLIDTLFPLTRSCEGFDDMQKHCGKCWHCTEREWAFGRLD